MKLVILAVFGGLLATSTNAAESRRTFCARWDNVCRSTCPPGTPVPTCHATCADRLNACLANGCYHFNRPGPRCQGQTR